MSLAVVSSLYPQQPIQPRRLPRRGRQLDRLLGQTGLDPILQGAADFDLELIETRTLDGNIQELTYRPALHV